MKYLNLTGDFAARDDAVRRLDEAVLVDARVGRQVPNQADVRAFRGLDGAHASVVRGVDVTNFEAGALTRQTARSQRRETALVGETRQRVVLVHELAELEVAKNSLMADMTGRMLISVWARSPPRLGCSCAHARLAPCVRDPCAVRSGSARRR